MANKPPKVLTELEKSQQLVAHCYPESAHLLPYLGEMVHTIASIIQEDSIPCGDNGEALRESMVAYVNRAIFTEKQIHAKQEAIDTVFAEDIIWWNADAEMKRLEKELAEAKDHLKCVEARILGDLTARDDTPAKIEAEQKVLDSTLSAIRDLATFGRLAGFWESTIDLGGIAGATEGIHLALRTQEANLRVTDAVALYLWLNSRRQGHYLTLSAKLGTPKVKASFVDELLKQAIADGSAPTGIEFGQVSLVKKGDLLTDGLPFITIEVAE